MKNATDFAAIREGMGKTQAGMAAFADVSEPLIRRLESREGDFSPRIRAKLAAAYGVSIESIPTRPLQRAAS